MVVEITGVAERGMCGVGDGVGVVEKRREVCKVSDNRKPVKQTSMPTLPPCSLHGFLHGSLHDSLHDSLSNILHDFIDNLPAGSGSHGLAMNSLAL